MPKEIARAKIIVEGKVQGVGFRYFVLQKAQESRLKGFTQNLPSGEVETVVEGEKIFIEDFFKILQRGPSGSKVTNSSIRWEEPRNTFRTFEIKS
ncbi:MAG: acylphosphatase [Leptospiraceae bacterium]|nr:acylphosphatase [Leptospiraceae bacterium]MCK6381812.1 acylphosphatase [Leptospiraceae bacterium]NUM42238.1 acylphosphatase [Leptospiraceae bacterium]